MATALITLAAMSCFLPTVLLIHFALCRLVRRPSHKPPQGFALLAVVIADVLGTLVGATVVWNDPNFWPILSYGFLFCNCVGGVYFVMFCNTESGRRYHLLELLLARKELETREIYELYSKNYIVETRLKRLLEWGGIRSEDNRLFVQKRWFLSISMLFYTWARILGYRWFPKPFSGRPSRASLPRINVPANLSAGSFGSPHDRM